MSKRTVTLEEAQEAVQDNKALFRLSPETYYEEGYMVYTAFVPLVVRSLFPLRRLTRAGRRLLDSPRENYLTADQISYACCVDKRTALLIYVPWTMLTLPLDEQPYHGLPLRVCHKLHQTLAENVTPLGRWWARICCRVTAI